MADYTMADLEGISFDKGATPDESSNPTTDTIPKRKRGRPKGSTNASKLLPVSEIENGVSQFMGLMGMGISVFNAYDGSVVLKQSDALAKSIAGMAAKDKKMHAQLTKILRAGSWAAVATAGIPIAVAIAANHGMMPEMFLMDTGVDPTIYNGGVVADDSGVGADSGNGDNNGAMESPLDFLHPVS